MLLASAYHLAACKLSIIVMAESLRLRCDFFYFIIALRGAKGVVALLFNDLLKTNSLLFGGFRFFTEICATSQ